MSKVAIKTDKGIVQKLRVIRDKMNEDMEDMSLAEIKEYLRKMEEKNSPQQAP